jgi:hypothetical protein
LKKIWFWFALAASSFAGYVSYHFLPDLFAMLSDHPLPASYLEILNTSMTVALAGEVALAAIFFAVLGLVLPALVEGVALARAKAKIESLSSESDKESHTLAAEFEAELSDLPLMAESIPAYARFLMEDEIINNNETTKGTTKHRSTLRAFISASQFFGPSILIEERLSGWLFRPLASLLQGYGLIIFVLAGLLGFHDYREALAVNGADNLRILWAWIEKGLFALSFTSIGALIILLFTKASFGLRKKQVNAFCRFLDHRYNFMPPSAMLGEVVMSAERENFEARKKLQELTAGITRSLTNNQRDMGQQMSQMADTIAAKTSQSIETALREPLHRFTEASGQISADRSELAATVIKSALQTFLEDMDKELGGQFKKTNVVLKSTAALSTKVEKSFIDALKHMEKQNGEQSQSVIAASKEINETLGNLKHFEKALQQVVASVQPTLDRVMENQAALMIALAEEKSASKTIGQAAVEMNKAAKASKDTVESFITLAEKLKDASRPQTAASLSGLAVAAQARAGKLPKPVSAADGNKLSKALQNLKEKAGSTGKLPKL